MKLCRKCKERDSDPGFETCAVCRGAERERLRALRQSWVDQKLCVRCGIRPARKGRRTCDFCPKQIQDARDKRAAERRDKGLCLLCERKAAVGKLHCSFHLQLLAERGRHKREQRKRKASKKR